MQHGRFGSDMRTRPQRVWSSKGHKIAHVPKLPEWSANVQHYIFIAFYADFEQILHACVVMNSAFCSNSGLLEILEIKLSTKAQKNHSDTIGLN